MRIPATTGMEAARDPATAPLNYIKLLTFFENRMKNLQITKSPNTKSVRVKKVERESGEVLKF
jgi:hypothetical protein